MTYPDFEYVDTRRVSFGTDEDGSAQFIPVCEKCGRYVKANDTIRFNEIQGLSTEPNATCSKCGPTTMIFEGFF